MARDAAVEERAVARDAASRAARDVRSVQAR